MNLEDVWRMPEEEIYPRSLGRAFEGPFRCKGKMFTGQFGQSNVGPRWLHYGVLEFAPIPKRRQDQR